LTNYTLANKDVFIIASNSWRNLILIEMDFEAKKASTKTFCITNITHSSAVNSSPSSRKKFFEVCEFTFDNFGEFGDA